MKTFWRLRKKDLYTVAIDLKKSIPELQKLPADDIENYLRGLDMVFYYREKVNTSVLIRLTLPFAFILMIILFVLTPINYIITGHWGYKMKWLANWFSALGF